MAIVPSSFGAACWSLWPHGIHVDRRANVLVPDGRDKQTEGNVGGGDLKRTSVLKIQPDVSLLMTLVTVAPRSLALFPALRVLCSPMATSSSGSHRKGEANCSLC